MAHAGCEQRVDEAHAILDGDGTLGLQPVAGTDLADRDVVASGRQQWLLHASIVPGSCTRLHIGGVGLSGGVFRREGRRAVGR